MFFWVFSNVSVVQPKVFWSQFSYPLRFSTRHGQKTASVDVVDCQDLRHACLLDQIWWWYPCWPHGKLGKKRSVDSLEVGLFKLQWCKYFLNTIYLQNFSGFSRFLCLTAMFLFWQTLTFAFLWFLCFSCKSTCAPLHWLHHQLSSTCFLSDVPVISCHAELACKFSECVPK